MDEDESSAMNTPHAFRPLVPSPLNPVARKPTAPPDHGLANQRSSSLSSTSTTTTTMTVERIRRPVSMSLAYYFLRQKAEEAWRLYVVVHFGIVALTPPATPPRTSPSHESPDPFSLHAAAAVKHPAHITHSEALDDDLYHEDDFGLPIVIPDQDNNNNNYVRRKTKKPTGKRCLRRFPGFHGRHNGSTDVAAYGVEKEHPWIPDTDISLGDTSLMTPFSSSSSSTTAMDDLLVPHRPSIIHYTPPSSRPALRHKPASLFAPPNQSPSEPTSHPLLLPNANALAPISPNVVAQPRKALSRPRKQKKSTTPQGNGRYTHPPSLWSAPCRESSNQNDEADSAFGLCTATARIPFVIDTAPPPPPKPKQQGRGRRRRDQTLATAASMVESPSTTSTLVYVDSDMAHTQNDQNEEQQPQQQHQQQQQRKPQKKRSKLSIRNRWSLSSENVSSLPVANTTPPPPPPPPLSPTVSHSTTSSSASTSLSISSMLSSTQRLGTATKRLQNKLTSLTQAKRLVTSVNGLWQNLFDRRAEGDSTPIGRDRRADYFAEVAQMV